MIRRFCDACDTEIQTNYVSDRLVAERNVKTPSGRRLTIKVELTVGTGTSSPGGATWNEGELCRDCILDTVAVLDTRPQMAPA